MGTDGEQPVIARQILPVFEVLGIRPGEEWLIPTGLGGKFPQPAIVWFSNQNTGKLGSQHTVEPHDGV